MRQAVPSHNKPSLLVLFAKTANITLFIATILIAILMLISFYSYHPQDPAWSNATTSSEIIHNYAGEQGAYFADIMFSAIGKTAWLLPFLLIGFGYQLFLKRQLLTVSLNTITIRIIGTLLAIFALSALLDLQSGNGGMMGGFIGTELTNFLSVIFSIDQGVLIYITKILFAILALIGFYLITGCGPISWADYCGVAVFWLFNQIFPQKKSETFTETVTALPKVDLTEDSSDAPFKQETINRMLDQDERKAPSFLGKLIPQEETKPAYIELDEEILQESNVPKTHDYELKTATQNKEDKESNHNPYPFTFNRGQTTNMQRDTMQQEEDYNSNDNAKSPIPPIFRNLQRDPNESPLEIEQNKPITAEHKALDPFNRELDDWDQFIRTPQEDPACESKEVEVVAEKGVPSIFKNLFKNRKRPIPAPHSDSSIDSSLQLSKRIPDAHMTKLSTIEEKSAYQVENPIEPTYSEGSDEDSSDFIEPSHLDFAIQNLNEKSERSEENVKNISAITLPQSSSEIPLEISSASDNVEEIVTPKMTSSNTPDLSESHIDYNEITDISTLEPVKDIESLETIPLDCPQTDNTNLSESITTTKPPIESPPLTPTNEKGMVFNAQSGMMEPTQIHYPMAGKLPGLELLGNPPAVGPSYDPEELDALGILIEDQFKHFNIEVKVVNAEPGPVITRFELDLAPGVKIAQINNLNKDIARALAVASVRIVEIIPGKPYIGLEIPNKNRQTVYFKEGLYADEYRNSHHPLTILLGKDVSGNQVVANLKDMPHLLIAGTTGSGKSVGINTILLSLLYKAKPEDLRLILIDPKMLELSVYDDIPHLLAPVVTDMKESANALRWAVVEMERRYLLMSKLRVRNILNFNDEVKSAIERGEPLDDPLWNAAHEVSDHVKAPKLEPLPYIVIVIDELADMMMSVGKAVEELIARLTQKARAAGIHLVVATQRPSVDVITGLIKANIPSRIAFQVSSKIDSRTILDQQGAENLLGQGDMLFFPARAQFPNRVHGAFVDDDEVNRVTDFLRLTGAPNYVEDILKEPTEEIPGLSENAAGYTPSPDDVEDVLYDEAVKIVLEDQRPTISYIQRKLRIGYQRAARLIETMEERGIVSAPANNGIRDILVKYD